MAVSQPGEIADKAHRFKCPGCGGDQAFEPRNGVLTCQYCQRQEPVPTSAEQIHSHSFADYLQERPAQQAVPDHQQEVKCGSCGATISFTPPEVAGECAFCGSKIVTQPQSPDPLVAPEAVLPFKVPQADAAGAVRAWLGSRWFAPNSLQKFARPDALQGIYLPFWTYDSYAVSQYIGERGDHYYETEYYTETDSDGNTVSKSREVQRTNWTPAAGVVQRWFDNVLVPGTTSLSEQKLQTLEPWDMAALEPYQPAFLSGYKAQRYQISVKPAFDHAVVRMASQIRQDVGQAIGGDEQRIGSVDTAYSSVTFKHILLPLWIGAYRYNDKVYQLMVNARTGQVQGERPYSFWKIAGLVLAIILAIAAIVWFQQGRPPAHPPRPAAPYRTSFIPGRPPLPGRVSLARLPDYLP